jgi:fumarate hydratase class II
MSRKEKDSMGEVLVPDTAYWGAQTERSLDNFKIGREKMPQELILSLVLIKKAAANANYNFKLLPLKKMRAINKACDEILHGKLLDQFPLVVWQTGSGTQSNMNVNEVIANRANEFLGEPKGTKSPIHPNDDVNMSQSSNDVFPSAIHIAAFIQCVTKLLPALDTLHKILNEKSIEFQKINKVGRTHLMDATNLSLGQEFSGYAAQVDKGRKMVKESLKELRELALGGTAVGTGLNAPKGFGKEISGIISELTGHTFSPAKNYFKALASSDELVMLSGALKTLATNLYKIANDIRWMASGPRCGLGELLLPENEPGSSIMPGKVNPTQSEALMMVCIQVMGNDAAIGFANSQGNFELNVCRPLIAYNLLQSIDLLAESIKSFSKNCARGIKPNTKRIQEHLNRSLMQATALNPIIGYDAAAKLVQKAHHEDLTLQEAAARLGIDINR